VNVTVEFTRGRPWRLGATLLALLALAGCTIGPRPEAPPPPGEPEVAAPEQPASTPPAPSAQEPTARFLAMNYAELPGWDEEDVRPAFLAFLQGCPRLKAQPAWEPVCREAETLALADPAVQRHFIESVFVPYLVMTSDGRTDGLLTGYYEPLLRGSRTANEHYRHPLYAEPPDLVTVELGEVVPEVKGLRLRGRLVGNRLVPYWTRAEIDGGKAQVKGSEIVWVEDALDLFFLQVQGSGRVQLENGEIVRVGYANQNGHPYRSVGKLLVDRGELTVEQASMQGIKAWAAANPDKLRTLLEQNPSYVFFRELPDAKGGPIGSLGVPLTAGRSLAVDPKFITLGAPVFINTFWPASSESLNRLMVAQDTGGAIRGPIRGDFFFGFGEEAGELAGRMRQPVRMWVLLPRSLPPVQ
jgi:membrane-bound lytic murein transglycosylase A